MAHGGFVFALADTAFAYACNTEGEPTVARQCEITFLRPAHVGEELIAVAELRSRAGRAGIYDVCVKRHTGDVVAELRGHSATLVPQGE
jgi:acyl-CoA thioesterase